MGLKHYIFRHDLNSYQVWIWVKIMIGFFILSNLAFPCAKPKSEQIIDIQPLCSVSLVQLLIDVLT